MSKGVQAKGRYVIRLIELQLDLYGEVPVEYVAAAIQLIKAQAALDPESIASSGEFPPSWLKRQLTSTEWDSAKRDVMDACKHLGSDRYTLRLDHPYNMITFSSMKPDLVIIPPLGWKSEIDRAKRKVRDFLRRYGASQ